MHEVKLVRIKTIYESDDNKPKFYFLKYNFRKSFFDILDYE